MKILLMSDIHTEHHKFDNEFGEIGKGADVIVLAGDIGQGSSGLRQLVNLFPKHEIVFVAGNHEFYGGEMSNVKYELKVDAAEMNVHYLENSRAIIDGVRFIGGTLWTDYLLYGERDRSWCMHRAQMCMNDYRFIQTLETNGHEPQRLTNFEPTDALAEHMRTRAYLEAMLAEPLDGKTVVVTHMAPSAKSIHSKYKGDVDTNACYASNLDKLVEKADFWFHGHMHDSADYMIGKCRVVCNPRGYEHWSQAQENKVFDPYKLIEV